MTWSADRRNIALEDFSSPHFELLNDYQINKNLTFKSSLFFFSGKGYFDYNGDWADNGYLTLTPENGFEGDISLSNTVLRGFVEINKAGWIPRLIWDRENGQTIFGAELRIHRSDHWTKINYAGGLPGNYDPNYKINSHDGKRDIASFFVRDQRKIGDNFLLNAEVQFVHQGYSIENNRLGTSYLGFVNSAGDSVGVNGDALFDVNHFFVNPRLGGTYTVNKNLNFYGLVAYTSREPRMKNLYNASESMGGKLPLFESELVDGVTRYNFDNPIVKPEKMLDIELGTTYRTNDVRLNANLYVMDYTDELVKSGDLDIYGSPIDGNADKSRHIGIELDGAGKLYEKNDFRLDLAANFTFSSNKILDFDYVVGEAKFVNAETQEETTKEVVISLDDNEIAGFPSLMGALRLDMKYKNFFAGVTGKFVGDFKTDNFGDMLSSDQKLIEGGILDGKEDPTLRQIEGYTDNTVDSYFIMNLNLNYDLKDFFDTKNIRFSLAVYNLLDELYASTGEGKEFFPGGQRQVYLGIELGL